MGAAEFSSEPDLMLGVEESEIQFADGTRFILCSSAMRRIVQMLKRVAQHDASVLIMGETGTGKELVARTIHRFSPRKSHGFVEVNCAALPEHLVESELFGYEKGAFSGADQAKPGLFEIAERGTIFLDEVGDLDPKIQVKLLRVLDGAPYFRLGGRNKVQVDVRVVAATNHDLEAAVRVGKFRRDLYHRLGQFQLRIPPLRDRPEDLIAIATSILHQQFPECQFNADALDALRQYPWPGNVRELRNTIFKTLVYAEDPTKKIGVQDLRFDSGEAQPPTQAEPQAVDLHDVEKRVILETLNRAGGHRGRAAEQLGISRRTLTRKLKLYRLEKDAVGGEGFGSLAYEQQRYFRASLAGPVVIRSGADEIHATSVNVSSSGIALRSPSIGECRSMVELSFALPNCAYAIQAKAQMAWLDPSGKAGFRFLDMPASCRHDLEAWLARQIEHEGWASDELQIGAQQ